MTDRAKTVAKIKEEIQLMKDVLELLEEQEPVKSKGEIIRDVYFWRCGKCGMNISRFWCYCPECGRQVKWNE